MSQSVRGDDLLRRYDAIAAEARFARDDAQRVALRPLQRLRDELVRAERVSLAARLLRRFSAQPGRGHAVRGIYLHGPVGQIGRAHV